MNILGFFQRLGRALQLPIAVLPVAALLLRFGQPDLLNVPFIAQAGGAIFDNLALIFAIGVASSWSKDNAGSAALAGAVGYFVMTKAMVTINPEINMGVLAGIITGLVAGAVYNRWAGIKLPDFLSFFGGKRFVPIATGFFCLILAAIFGYVWPPVQHAIHSGGEWIVSAGALGSGIFGFINRLLIPTGLHQVLNTITAVEALNALSSSRFALPPSAIAAGIAAARFPARLELLRQSPPVLVDGAHNPNGGRALCDAVKSLGLHDLTAVVGMLRDKDCLPVLRMMAPYCARMIITTVPNPRSYPAEEFAELARGVCRDITICPDCEEAARLALATAGEHGVLVFGSLYLASAVRPVMLEALKKN